jgi:hypothetical protein
LWQKKNDTIFSLFYDSQALILFLFFNKMCVYIWKFYIMNLANLITDKWLEFQYLKIQLKIYITQVAQNIGKILAQCRPDWL